MDMALNNLQWLICHKNQTKPNHPVNKSSNQNLLRLKLQIFLILKSELKLVHC